MTVHAPLLRRVLVTNDDGIDAPGLAVAVEVAQAIAEEVWVSAPHGDCSGTSRQVSLHQPLRVIERDARTIAVTGSPADSIIVGLRHLMADTPPDLVISGINAGANHAKEVGYSGTVGAAITARIMGFKAVALSQFWISRENLPWDTSRAWLPKTLRKIIEADEWPPTSIYNINVPNCTPDEVTGIEMTRLGMGIGLDMTVERRVDNREKDYFWLRFVKTPGEELPDSDVAAIERRAVSVTPVTLDQTDFALKESLTL